MDVNKIELPEDKTDDDDKYKKRKRQNRIYAKISRERKKRKIENLEKENKELKKSIEYYNILFTEEKHKTVHMELFETLIQDDYDNRINRTNEKRDERDLITLLCKEYEKEITKQNKEHEKELTIKKITIEQLKGDNDILSQYTKSLQEYKNDLYKRIEVLEKENDALITTLEDDLFLKFV
jgi:hypothetical protein